LPCVTARVVALRRVLLAGWRTADAEVEVLRKQKEEETKRQRAEITRKIMMRLEGGASAKEDIKRDEMAAKVEKAKAQAEKDLLKAESDKLRAEAARVQAEAAKQAIEAERIQAEALKAQEQAQKAAAAAAKKEAEEASKREADALETELEIAAFQTNWTSAQLCAWLGQVGFAKEATLFAHHDLDGADILYLLPDDLDELGVKDDQKKKNLLVALEKAKRFKHIPTNFAD